MLNLNVYEDIVDLDGFIPDSLVEVFTLYNTKFGIWDPIKKIRYEKPTRITVPVCLLQGNTIPTSSLNILLDFLEENNIEYKIYDLRKGILNPVNYNWDNNIKFREYQLECINKVSEYTRGFFVVPTGGGKTLISKALIQYLGVTVLYLVPKRELVTQAIEELSDLGNVGEFKSVDKIYDINICTVSKIWNLYKKNREEFEDLSEKIDMLFGDEIHHSNILTYKNTKGKTEYGSWFTIFTNFKSFYKYGCTATPGTKGSFEYKSLLFSVGPERFRISQEFLEKQGFLNPIEVHMYDVVIENDSYDWNESLNNLIGNFEYNKLIAKLVTKYNNLGLSVAVLIDRVEKQVPVLSSLLPDAEIVIGSTNKKERLRIKNRLKKEKIVVISSVYGEGVDIPSLDVGVIVSGVGEKIITQKVGRLTRLYKDKNKGIIIDFYHLDGYDDSSGKRVRRLLEIHSQKREKLYKKKNFKVIRKVRLND